MKKAPLPGIWPQIVKLKEQGLTDQDAADRLGIPKATYQIKLVNMRKLGFELPPAGQPGPVTIPPGLSLDQAASKAPKRSAQVVRQDRKQTPTAPAIPANLAAEMKALNDRLTALEAKVRNPVNITVDKREGTVPKSFRLPRALAKQLEGEAKRQGLSSEADVVAAALTRYFARL